MPTKEENLETASNNLLSAGHAVSVTASDTTMGVTSTLRDGADPTKNTHKFSVSTKSEALITALLSALATTGLEPPGP